MSQSAHSQLQHRQILRLICPGKWMRFITTLLQPPLTGLLFEFKAVSADTREILTGHQVTGLLEAESAFFLNINSCSSRNWASLGEFEESKYDYARLKRANLKL